MKNILCVYTDKEFKKYSNKHCAEGKCYDCVNRVDVVTEQWTTWIVTDWIL